MAVPGLGDDLDPGTGRPAICGPPSFVQHPGSGPGLHSLQLLIGTFPVLSQPGGRPGERAATVEQHGLAGIVEDRHSPGTGTVPVPSAPWSVMAPVSIPARGRRIPDADLFIPPRHQRDPIDRAPTTGAHRGEHGFRSQEPLHPGEPSCPLVMLPIRSPGAHIDGCARRRCAS